MSKIDYQALREAAEAIKIAATPQKLLAFRMKVTPQVVLALLDEREAKDKAWSAQDNHINQQAYRIESLEKKNGELGRSLEAAEKRIAELEAREISLPERSSMLHRTDFHEDYQTVMAYKVSEVIAAIRAAGIRIKGE